MPINKVYESPRNYEVIPLFKFGMSHAVLHYWDLCHEEGGFREKSIRKISNTCEDRLGKLELEKRLLNDLFVSH